MEVTPYELTGLCPDGAEHAGARADHATGLLRIGFVASGRDTQSSAFFSVPGIDELNSGVVKKTASASRTASRIRATASGAFVGVVVGVVRRDVAQPVVDLELRALGLEQLAGMAQKRRVV